MEKIRLNSDTIITKEILEYIIEKHREEKLRIERLNRYYKCQNDILNRVYRDKKKPQNRLANGYATYITNMAVGYFLGSPISYKFKDEALREKVTEIFNYNDENDVNTTLAKQSSIGGYSVELLYTDEDTNIRFKPLNSSEMAIVYDTTLEENIIFAVRYFEEKDVLKDSTYTYIEVYDKDKISFYKLDKDSFKEIKEPQEHFFKDVPISVYSNNDECMGDFERVLSLIDAYDKTSSDTANDFEMFTHAMLIISGYLVDEKDRQDIVDKWCLNFQGENGKAEYLIKDIQDTALENYKNRLDNDIHKFAQIPNMSDESFGNNSSGISLQFKLMGIENITSVKESKFKKGLMRRIELICNIINLKSDNLMTYLDIEPVFTRTRPINKLEEAQRLQILSGLYAKETVLSLSTDVQDVQAELDRQEKEANSLYENEYSDLEKGNINGEE